MDIFSLVESKYLRFSSATTITATILNQTCKKYPNLRRNFTTVTYESKKAKLARLAAESKRVPKTQATSGNGLRQVDKLNFVNSDHYDYSLFGTNYEMDSQVSKHQRQVVEYGQGKYHVSITNKLTSLCCVYIYINIYMQYNVLLAKKHL